MEPIKRLDSIEWQAKYVYLAQLENFKFRDLTDEEKVVVKWMEDIVEDLIKRSP